MNQICDVRQIIYGYYHSDIAEQEALKKNVFTSYMQDASMRQCLLISQELWHMNSHWVIHETPEAQVNQVICFEKHLRYFFNPVGDTAEERP